MEQLYQFKQYTFFTQLSELVLQHNAYDLTLGIPDYDIDDQLKNFLKEAACKNKNQYEPLAGSPFLIDSLILYNSKRAHPIHLKYDEINIIPCSTFGLYVSLKSILEKGDEVIVIEPCYFTYVPNIVINGGIPKFVQLANDFSIDWNLLEEAITEKTKAIIINSPQNPTGKMWKKEDWNQLYEIIKDKDIYLISEEIYDIYCYDGQEHYSSYLHPELKDRTFSIFSFGKMFHATGWKVSYMLASSKLLEKFRLYQQYISFSTNTPAQHAIAQFLQIFQAETNRNLMQQKRDTFCELMKDLPFEIKTKAEGTFYQLVNFRNITKTLTDVEFSHWLTTEKQVACLPLSAFYYDKKNSDYVRFSFTRKDEVLINAIEKLRNCRL